MSNLSELLPTGGGQNAVEFTAAENIASGQAVALKTDGQIEAADSANLANVIGLAAAAITSGATGDINVFGGINEAQSSLTIGTNYYINSSGSLSTSATVPNVELGQAISATTINLRDFSDNHNPLVQGQQAYTSPGSYTWVAPAGVTSVSVFVVGGGGGGGGGSYYGGDAGGGGGAGYKNNYSISSHGYITVGSAGTAGSSSTNGGNGGYSIFVPTDAFGNPTGPQVTAYGGTGGPYGASGAAVPGGGNTGFDGGGTGGAGGQSKNFTGGGGGGAAGYSGNGGAGGSATSYISSGNGGPGAGGGGGGGGQYYGGNSPGSGGGGGGVGLLGQGSNGAGGSNDLGSPTYAPAGGGGGSGGTAGVNAIDGSLTGAGSIYGGGGGAGGRYTSTLGAAGANGGVRIIWSNGATRAYPSTNTGDV